MQSIQQAYLGTRERAVVVLEGWDIAGKRGIERRLGWALYPKPRSRRMKRLVDPSQHRHDECASLGETELCIKRGGCRIIAIQM